MSDFENVTMRVHKLQIEKLKTLAHERSVKEVDTVKYTDLIRESIAALLESYPQYRTRYCDMSKMQADADGGGWDADMLRSLMTKQNPTIKETEMKNECIKFAVEKMAVQKKQESKNGR